MDAPRPVLVTLISLAAVVAGCLQDRADNQPGPGPLQPLFAPDCTIANWIEPCLALASPNDSPSKTEIDLAVNPKDPLNVVVASKDLDKSASGCVWAVAQASKDGGKTWTTSYLGGKTSERKPGDPLYGWGCITDPIFAFDKEGWVYYALQAYNAGTNTNRPPAGGDAGVTSGSQFFLARSKDGGMKWDKIIPLHVGDGTLVFHDYPRMASNPATGSTFVIWNQFNTLPVNVPGSVPGPRADVTPVFAGTRDRGETPIQPVYLVPANDPRAGQYGIDGFAIGKDGTLYVTLDTYKDDKVSEVWLIKSTDDGRTWSAPAKIFEIQRVTPAQGQGRVHTPTTKFRMSSAVEIAIDTSDGPTSGCLHAVWIGNGTGDADVLARKSCDALKSNWGPPVRVNRDNGTAWQMMVRNAVTSDGVVHVVYHTQAYDPAQRLLDAEYAYSEDGTNWTTRRLTTTSFDGDKGIHQDGFPFFGDYNGIGASGTTVYVGFADSASGRAEIAVARLVKTSAAAASTSSSEQGPVDGP